jgi:cytochrome c
MRPSSGETPQALASRPHSLMKRSSISRRGLGVSAAPAGIVMLRLSAIFEQGDCTRMNQSQQARSRLTSIRLIEPRWYTQASMHDEPGAEAGALATQPAPAAPVAQPLRGGAGLYDHAARDPFAPSAGMWAGVTALVATVLVAGVLVVFNPAFSSGRAAGTPNQLGAPPASAAGPQAPPGSPAAEGQQMLASKPCVGCHVIPGVPGATGTVGPSLAGVSSRARIAGGAVPNSGPDDLKAWIMNPGGLKPGTAMPPTGLTDDEATKIAAYLELLE